MLCLPYKFLGIQVIHYSLCPNSCPHAEHTVHNWAKNVKEWQDALSSGCVLSLRTGSITSSKDTQPCGFNFVFSGTVQGFVTWGMRGWQVILPKKQYQPGGENSNSTLKHEPENTWSNSNSVRQQGRGKKKKIPGLKSLEHVFVIYFARTTFILII